MSSIDTASWKEFRLDELFGEPIRGTRLVKEQRVVGDIPLVTAGFNNQGIAEFISNEEQTTFNGGLTIDMFGNCFYRDYEFKADDNILVFDSEDMPKEAKLFIVTSINKVTHGLYSYGNQYRMKSFNNTIIKLPVKESEEIDWEYMQEYITELEQERITELEQYLIATGLNDYELTDEDKEILATKLTDVGALQSSISGNGCLKEARMFRVGDLFVSRTGDTDLQKYHINGNGYYVVSSGLENNGVIGKTDVTAKIFDADTITIDMFGNCFYRDEQYKMVTHARVFSLLPLFDGLNKCNGQYIVSQFKYLPSIYNYSNMCSWNKIQNDELYLPIQTDNNDTPVIDQNHTYHPDGYIPDWTYMENYIRAIEKVVIRDALKYKDSIIAKTKEIVA